MQYILYLKSHFKKYKKERIPLIAFDTNDPTNVYYYWLSKEQIKVYKHEGFWNVEWNRILALREDIADDIKNWSAFDIYPFKDWFDQNFAFLPRDLVWEKKD